MKRSALLVLMIAVAAVFGLAGCVTPYQADAGSGGYRERQIDSTTWFVGFRGGADTKIDDVFVYWLYRCAEITQREGYTHFLRVDRKMTTGPGNRIFAANRWSGPAPLVTAPSLVPAKGGGLIFVPMYQGPPVPDPEVTGMVKLLREVPEDQKGFAYDAAQILRDHAARVQGKAGSTAAPSKPAS